MTAWGPAWMSNKMELKSARWAARRAPKLPMATSRKTDRALSNGLRTPTSLEARALEGQPSSLLFLPAVSPLVVERLNSNEVL